MNFGVFTMFNIREGASQAQTFTEWLKVVQEAERLGIDVFWLGESHFRPDRAVVSSPLTVASAVAARTSRMRIGIAVQVLPLANPISIAEAAATVDHISEGRLDFGVGRSSFLDAYMGYNVDYEESRARFSESLEIILKAWGEKPFSHEGEFYSFKDVDLVPKPLQKPHPPIRIAVESMDTFRLVGKLGFPIFIRYQMSIPKLQDLLTRVQKCARGCWVLRPQRCHPANTRLRRENNRTGEGRAGRERYETAAAHIPASPRDRRP